MYYLVEVLLGPGSAGTPSPAPGAADASAQDLPKEVAAKAWPNVVFPDGDLRCADLEIRALAAAARCF